MTVFTPYGLGIAAAFAATLGLAGLLLRRRISLRSWLQWGCAALGISWLTARLVYVLGDATYYLTTLSRPDLALRFWDGGYAMSGAIIGWLLAARLLEKPLKLPRCSLVAAAATALPLGLMIARLTETGTGMGLGREILTPWLAFLGVPDETGLIVHPVRLYEAAAAAVLLIVLLMSRLPDRDKPLLLLTVYGASQALLESLRNDGHLVVHFVRIQQVLALFMLFFALLMWTRRLRHNRREQWIAWGIVLAATAAAVAMEFVVDSSENKLLTYAVMAACMTAAAWATLRAGKRARMKEST